MQTRTRISGILYYVSPKYTRSHWGCLLLNVGGGESKIVWNVLADGETMIVSEISGVSIERGKEASPTEVNKSVTTIKWNRLSLYRNFGFIILKKKKSDIKCAHNRLWKDNCIKHMNFSWGKGTEWMILWALHINYYREKSICISLIMNISNLSHPD